MQLFGSDLDSETRLELLMPGHAERLFRLIDKSRDTLGEWFPWVDSHTSSTDTLRFIDGCLAKFSRNNGFYMGVWYHGEVAGLIGLRRTDWTNRKTRLAYWLGDGFRGKGLMRKASRRLVDFAFQEWKMNRVEILCAEGNVASQTVPRSLGFREEGTLRQMEWLRDRYVDHILFSMLQEEWMPGSLTEVVSIGPGMA